MPRSASFFSTVPAMRVSLAALGGAAEVFADRGARRKQARRLRGLGLPPMVPRGDKAESRRMATASFPRRACLSAGPAVALGAAFLDVAWAAGPAKVDDPSA